MSNLPEVARSAKTHRCYTIRSRAVGAAQSGASKRPFPGGQQPLEKWMFPFHLSSYLFLLPFLFHSSPRHRGDLSLLFSFVFLQNGHCFVLYTFYTALQCPPRSTPYFFHQALCLHSIPSPWVCLSHSDALHCHLSQDDATHRALQHPCRDWEEPGALASRRGPAGSGLSSSPARGYRTAVPAGVSPHHHTLPSTDII